MFYKMKAVVILLLLLIDGYTSYRPACDYCNHPKACRDICDKDTFWFDVRRIKYICKKYCDIDLTKKCLCKNGVNTTSSTRSLFMEKPTKRISWWKRTKQKISRCLEFCTGANFWTRMACVFYCLKNLDP